MAELNEVFEMTTKQMEPDQDSWNQQERRQRRTTRNRKVGAFALVACIVVGAILVVKATDGQRTEPPPSVAAPGGTGQTLSIVDIGSGTSTAITVPLGAADFDVTLDGSMIAYTDLDGSGNAQVFVMDADGSNARQLTHGDSGSPRHPSWSPDGSEIAYEGDASDNSQIFVVRVSDGVSTMVTQEPRGAVDPGGWAPDGRTIVYSAINVTGDLYTARSIDLQTGRSRLIVPDGSTPELSPDGTRIAFNSWLKPLGRLMFANSDGSERRIIARGLSDDGYERWSPDSAQMAYVGNTNDGGSGTFVYDLTTGESRFVTAGAVESWIDNDHILVVP